MAITTIDASRNTMARVAGLAYLLTLATIVTAHYGIYPRLIVAGDAAATARSILGHELLFRTIIACDLVYAAGVVVLLAAFYAIQRPVHRGLALLGAFFRLVYASMWVLTAFNLFVALRLLRGPTYMGAFEADQLQALARLPIGSGFEAYYVGLPFYGLASTVCSYLFWKSNDIPRALAMSGVIASAWCVVSAFAFIVVPHFGKAVNPYWFDSPMGIFEIVMSGWLLFRGLGPSGIAVPRTQAGAA